MLPPSTQTAAHHPRSPLLTTRCTAFVLVSATLPSITSVRPFVTIRAQPGSDQLSMTKGGRADWRSQPTQHTSTTDVLGSIGAASGNGQRQRRA